MVGRPAGIALVVTADVGTLDATYCAPARLWVDLHTTSGTLTVDRLAGNLAAAGLFAAALWVAVGLAAAAVAVAPGVPGRAGRRVACALLPRLLQRIVAGTAGLGVLLSPVAAGAATSSGSAVPRPTTSTSAPVWPVGTSTPAQSKPHTPAPHTPAPRTTPTDPADPVTPGSAAPPPARDSTAVTVAGGDSLWLIAARRLGAHASDAQVARAWPQIYTANRTVIGDDPSLIQPGQHLMLPASSVQEQS